MGGGRFEGGELTRVRGGLKGVKSRGWGEV